MDLISLTEYIVKSIVTNKDIVQVKELETKEENTLTIQVLVSEKDIPKVIGKNGKIANSIRNLVQVSSSLKENKFVKIKIEQA